MLIEKLIGDLLLRHNCVVVPSFGGFVSKQTSAVIDYKTGVMHPPKKSLLFNKQLINNDGLLASVFAKEASLSFDEASSEIQKQVISWHKALNSGDRINLENIGFLFLDQEKNIGFEQDRYFNILLQSYGLGKVHFISEEDIQLVAQPMTLINPIAKEDESIIEMHPTAIRPIEKTLEVETKEISIAPQRHFKIWKYIAAASMIPFVFYSYWIPMETNVLESKIISISDFNPFHKSVKKTYTAPTKNLNLDSSSLTKISIQEEIDQLPNTVDSWSYPFNEDLYIPLKTGKVNIKEEFDNSTKSEPEIQKNDVESQHVIANCFSREENATNFVKTLKSNGFQAKIVDFKGGLYRVSAGKINTSSELEPIQSKLEQMDVQGSWILKTNAK
jgi:hypothetical protein